MFFLYISYIVQPLNGINIHFFRAVAITFLKSISNIFMSNDKQINEDDLKVLHLVHNNPKISQRGIAQKMGFSLGKVNYCIKALTEVGFIKMQNFFKSQNKAGYLYLLTPKGVSEKTAN